jgi:hypothetical protein
LEKIAFEELHNLCFSPNIIRIIKSRRMTWTGYVARMGVRRNGCIILAGKPERKKPLGKLRRRWVDNIKINLGKIEFGGMDWIDLV